MLSFLILTADGAVVGLLLANTFSHTFEATEQTTFRTSEKCQFLLPKQSWSLDTDDPPPLFSYLPLWSQWKKDLKQIYFWS